MISGVEKKIFHIDDSQCVFGSFSADPLKILVTCKDNSKALLTSRKIKNHFLKLGCDVKGPIDQSQKKSPMFMKVVYLKNFDSAAIKSAMSLSFSPEVSIEIHSCE